MKADLAYLAVDMKPAAGATPLANLAGAPETRMKLRYGFNETQSWRQFALGADRERIWTRLRDVDTRIIRMFTFTPHAPDPDGDWKEFAACVQAVLQVGAIPMITFVRLPQSFDDPGAARQFARRCASVAERCIDTWGGQAVRQWAWSIGNKPNSEWTGGATFDHYRRLYEDVAQMILSRLEPCLGGRRPMIGGPGVDGFRPFWMDWIWRFVNEIDNSLIGFVSWNRYGDWREPGTWDAPLDEGIFRKLLMSRTAEYGRRAQSIARAVRGRGILNICSELNAHAHHEAGVSGRFNQTTFGAAYYGSALIHLMRGEADAEMLWTGTDDGGPYGVVDRQGRPNPVYYAKQLCARHVCFGDRIEFPTSGRFNSAVDLVVASREDSRRSAFLAHIQDEPATYDLSRLSELTGCARLLTVDGDGAQIVEKPFDGTVTFRGYGVAVITNGPGEVP